MGKSLLQNKSLALLPVIALLISITGVNAGQVGGLSGAYLRPAVGASALAMGGASAAAPDYLAPWWNPAVLANLHQKKFSFGAGTRSMGRSDLYTEYEMKVPPRLGMGFLVLYRGDPFLNNLYNDDYDNPEKLQDASYTTITGKVSVAYYISKKLSAGASIGMHYQQLPTSTNDNGKWNYSSATGIGAFDIAATYKYNDHLSFAVVTRDLFALMNWELDDGTYSPTVEDRPIPSFTVASKYSDSLRHRPFIWTADLKGYLVDGKWKSLSRPEAYLSSGLEWQYWSSFYLRFGLGDILLNGDITRNPDDYFSEFPCKITAGFSVELSKFRKGMFINYGMATDKTWAGIDQQLDMTMSF